MTTNSDDEKVSAGSVILFLLELISKKIFWAFIFICGVYAVLRFGGSLLDIKPLVDASVSDLFKFSLLVSAILGVYRINYPRLRT